MANTNDIVLDFIKQFRDLGAENCFSNGMCYWFASILKRRFLDEHCHLMYDEIANHFGCEINGIVYDITGIVTKEYDWEPWIQFSTRDYKLTERIERDCIDKLPPKFWEEV